MTVSMVGRMVGRLSGACEDIGIILLHNISGKEALMRVPCWVADTQY